MSKNILIIVVLTIFPFAASLLHWQFATLDLAVHHLVEIVFISSFFIVPIMLIVFPAIMSRALIKIMSKEKKEWRNFYLPIFISMLLPYANTIAYSFTIKWQAWQLYDGCCAYASADFLVWEYFAIPLLGMIFVAPLFSIIGTIISFNLSKNLYLKYGTKSVRNIKAIGRIIITLCVLSHIPLAILTSILIFS